MQEPCGQCRAPFTHQCTQMIHCHKHKSQCFSCLKCDDHQSGSHDHQSDSHRDQIISCIICHRTDQIQNMYYDYNCDSHMCRFHFLKIDFNSAEITLPCGHKQDRNDVLMFMTSYCILCGRRLRNSKKVDQLNICVGCQKKGFQQQKKTIKQSQLLKTHPSQVQQEQPQKISENRAPVYSQASKLINQIKSEMLLLKQSLKVSQFTRNQIKQAINHIQRDKDCIICLQPFNLSNKKPMMVCLQQHLLCQHCLHHQPSLSNCPLCREEIPKQKVLASRERMKTIQLQIIISQKYQTKLQKCLIVQTTVLQEPKQVIKQPEQLSKKQTQPDKVEIAPALLTENKQHKQPLKQTLVTVFIPRINRGRLTGILPKRGRPPSANHNGAKKQKK